MFRMNRYIRAEEKRPPIPDVLQRVVKPELFSFTPMDQVMVKKVQALHSRPDTFIVFQPRKTQFL